jgi:uncharacterized membrane protein
VVGTVDTMLVAWLISGDPASGLTIGGVEAIVKTVMYYFHERIWHLSKYGLVPFENESERI